MKTTKLALFNSARGNYSQKSFQPSMELPTVIRAKRKEYRDEIAKRKQEFEKIKCASMDEKFMDSEYKKFDSKNGRFSMKIPTEVLQKFPSEREVKTKAQLRAERRREVQLQMRNR